MVSDLDNHPDSQGIGHLPDHGEPQADGPAVPSPGVEQPLLPSGKPKPLVLPEGFHGIPNARYRERQLLVRKCLGLRFSVEQMVDFLPTQGLKLSRSQVYEYLKRLKAPPGYERSERFQDPHDYFCRRILIRLAKDFPVPLSEIEINQYPFPGARFRPDSKFFAGKPLYFTEVQLEPLGALWAQKHLNYVRLYEILGRFFQVLMIVRQGDLDYIREQAKKVLTDTGHPSLNLFYYCKLKDFEGFEGNVAKDPFWLGVFQERKKLSLL